VNPARQPARGDIWDLDLNPIKGREQAGRRPALIVSVDPFNRGPADLIVAVPPARLEQSAASVGTCQSVRPKAGWRITASLSARTCGRFRNPGWRATAAGCRRSRWLRSKIGCGFCSGYSSMAA